MTSEGRSATSVRYSGILTLPKPTGVRFRGCPCPAAGGPNVIVHTYFILNLLPVFVMIPLRTIRRGEHLGWVAITAI